MSRETTAMRLIGEAYAATAHEPERFRPMDPRRLRRLLAIFEDTSYDCAETLNRAFGAAMCSQAHRKETRKNKQEPHS